MENPKRIRNEKGQFQRVETVFSAEKPSQGNLRPSEPIVQVTTTEYDQLKTVRTSLHDLGLVTPLEANPIEPVVLEAPAGGGVIQQKEMKKRVRKAKEQSPKMFEERLLVFNDPQLLRSADDEAIGAFVKYGEDTGKTVTHFIINGDLTDNERASVFPKMPQSGEDVAGDEIEATRWFIKKSEQMFPNAELVMVMGNHDKERYLNYLKGHDDGLEHFMKSYEEVMGIGDKWKVIEYGAGGYYKWHDRIIWHGHRSGSKSHIAKLELQDAGVSVTTAHINKNQYHEERDALGNLKVGLVHGGFSKDNLHFMKTANTNWSQGFGEYFWSKQTGEQPYSIVIRHGNPRFIAPNGKIYDGTGYNLREEIGLEVKRGRGRPRKIYKG